MEQTEQDKVMAFDTLFTNNHIKMMKVLMTYFDSGMQKMLAVYIKYLELQYTISYFQKHTTAFPASKKDDGALPIGPICREILPYCTAEERSRVEQINNMMSAMDTYREVSQMMEMMKDLFPEGTSSPEGSSFFNGGAGMNSDMLSSILGPEASSMFEMFAAMNQDSNNK